MPYASLECEKAKDHGFYSWLVIQTLFNKIFLIWTNSEDTKLVHSYTNVWNEYNQEDIYNRIKMLSEYFYDLTIQ